MKILKLSLLVFSGFLLTNCDKEPNFSVIPVIEFKSVQKRIVFDDFSQSYKDSIIVSLFFQDGDGDLGKTSEEFGIDKLNNYHVRTFRKENGIFKEVTFSQSISGYFLPLNSSNIKGPREGLLNYSLSFFHNLYPKNDTIQLKISISDRALNRSNEITTSPIIRNQK